MRECSDLNETSDTQGKRPEEQSPSPCELLRNTVFEIGGTDQLSARRLKWAQEPTDDGSKQAVEAAWQETLADLHIRTGTLLKADTVSFLLGAGASCECGGPLIGTIPLALERNLLQEGVGNDQEQHVPEWLQCFYLAVRRSAGSATTTPVDPDEIIARKKKFGNATPVLPVNLELLLSTLYRWRAALPSEGGRLRLDGQPEVDLTAKVIDECLHHTTSTLADLCKLPRGDGCAAAFEAYKVFLRKVLTRPLNLRRANIFTLNYDTLVEQAADDEGVVLIDGFVGTIRRVFRPECYDHDLYFPAETTEGRVHRLDRVLHLYKLHGSITWVAEEPSWDNPYGVRAYSQMLPGNNGRVLIYPTPAKAGEVLGMPYSELFRRFAAMVVRSQSVLFVIGYGFGDEHVNAIVRQAMAIPSFTLVIVDPSPKGDFVKSLRRRQDSRVWVLSGETIGKFSGFVKYALADLRDEEIRKRVVGTYRALSEKDEKTGETAGIADGGASNG